MPDPTTITLHCTNETYAANRNLFDSHFGEPNVGSHAELYTETAEYGIIPELERWASARLVFYGHHDNGNSYPQRVFAADGIDGRLHWAYTMMPNGHPIVAIQDDGRADPAGLARVQAYLPVRQRAEAAVPTDGGP